MIGLPKISFIRVDKQLPVMHEVTTDTTQAISKVKLHWEEVAVGDTAHTAAVVHGVAGGNWFEVDAGSALLARGRLTLGICVIQQRNGVNTSWLSGRVCRIVERQSKSGQHQKPLSRVRTARAHPSHRFGIRLCRPRRAAESHAQLLAATHD